MLDTILTQRNVNVNMKITGKALVTLAVTVMAVLLPQLVHMALGQPGGVKWLPMYLPVLVGGCLLGTGWGFAAGLLSPLASFFVTSALGLDPMPAAARLPFMMAELAVFAVVSGLFSKKIAKNSLWAFLAVISAQTAGRGIFLASVALFSKGTPFTVPMIWGQIKTGFTGLALQAVLAPVIIIALKKCLIKGENND